MNNIIQQGDPLYPILYQQWRRNGGTSVTHDGTIYEVVKDNEVIRFASSGSSSPFGFYEQTSMGKRG